MATHHTHEKKPADAGFRAVTCGLAIDSNGRFYIEPSTSDGEVALRSMLSEGVAVTITPSEPQSATGVAAAMG